MNDRIGYFKGMADLNQRIPVTEEVQVDEETLTAIDRGIKRRERRTHRLHRRSSEDDPQVDLQIRILEAR